MRVPQKPATAHEQHRRNISDLILSKDWMQLIRLATENDDYITNIIETDTSSRRKKDARIAYARFVQTVIC